MTNRTKRRLLGLVTVIIVLASACGGDDDTSSASSDDSASAPTATVDTSSGDGAASADDSSASSDDSSDSTDDSASTADDDGSTAAPEGDVNKGFVSIGDKTYEFDVDNMIAGIGRCDPDFFGAFWVLAAMADGSPGGLEMLIVPDDAVNHDETSKVKVDVVEADGRDWRADADGGEGTPEGVSSVDSFTIKDGTVTGTATFVDIEVGDGATATGEFQFTCPT